MQRRIQHEKITRAFPYQGADDSHRDRIYTRDEALDNSGALLSLESEIHSLASAGDREGVRRALYQYLRLRGVL